MSQCNERSKQTASAIKHKRASARRHSGSSSGCAVLGCINSNWQEAARLKQRCYRYHGWPCEKGKDTELWYIRSCHEASHRSSAYTFILPQQTFIRFKRCLSVLLLSINNEMVQLLNIYLVLYVIKQKISDPLFDITLFIKSQTQDVWCKQPKISGNHSYIWFLVCLWLCGPPKHSVDLLQNCNECVQLVKHKGWWITCRAAGIQGLREHALGHYHFH